MGTEIPVASIEPAASSKDWRRGRVIDAPPPTSPPTYKRSPGNVTRAWTIQEAIDGTFFVVGALLVLWLGVELVTKGLSSPVYAVGYLIVFWTLLSYIALPRLDEFLAKIYVPDYFIGRTVTSLGILGDPVNLAVDGDAESLRRVMEAAGWTRADPVTLRSSWGIIRSAVFRSSYPAAPVSPLLLFGRQEDMAFEREVDGNASQRHHIRFWQVPEGWVLPGGYAVGWLASATYDRKVGLSLFTLQVTHKVDADIDAERDYVVASARYATPSVTLRVIENFSTAFHTRNGGGDLVHGDGNLVILDLTTLAPEPAPQASRSAESESTGQVAGPRTPGTPGHKVLSRKLAPPALLASGVMSIAKAGLSLADVLTAALGSARHDTTGGLILISVSAVATILLWALTLGRQPWARTVLMAVCTIDAISEMVTLTRASNTSQLLLGTTSLSVLILIAVSSAQARRWTTPHNTRDRPAYR
jgi:hypothetical protein